MKKFLYMNCLLASLGGCGNQEEPIDAQLAVLQQAESSDVRRTKKEYSYTKVASVGAIATGTNQYASYFFPHGLNAQGDVFFSAGLDNGQQSFFRMQNRQPTERFGVPGQPAPGGGTFGDSISGFGTAMNQQSDAVFQYFVDSTYDDSKPVGRDGAVYRADASGHITPLLRPKATLAPNGKPFLGTWMYSSINNHKDVAFTGMIETTKGIKVPKEPPTGLGMGVFKANSSGSIVNIVSPGDPAPSRGVFDFAENPSINDRGDIAFGGHVAGEDCVTLGTLTQADRIFCGESVYLYRSGTGRVVSIAHQGETAPGGGKYRLAFGPLVNNQGDILFVGDLTPPPGTLAKNALFLWSHGSTVAVARPGDSMPGGGHMLSASGYVQGYSLNDRGEIFFFATLDTDKDGDGQNDSGVFAWKDGLISVILRTGTTIPTVGTISSVASGAGYGGAVSNDYGEVLSSVTTTAGNTYLLKSTPR